ncbi:MAG: chemotaxis protein CheA [Desulfobacteraceae bacterium]|nr:chemotaxis protein CheA [Desulfobacteraceae bacterium]
MTDKPIDIGKKIEEIALNLITMEGEDIPIIGDMLNGLKDIASACNGFEETNFKDLVDALYFYLEKIALRETVDFQPLETGLEHLQRYYQCIGNQTDYTINLTPILKTLGAQAQGPPEQVANGQEQTDADSCQTSQEPFSSETFNSPDPNLNDEDREIINDFISESLEGLAIVEVSLIDLEQNPDDKESINAIFRCFHTIKGVSSFLEFMRINHLAHEAENLLEKIRCRDLTINEEITDIILDSMDLLKRLISRIPQAMETGACLDIGLNIAPLVKRIEQIHDQTELSQQPVGQIMLNQGSITKDDLNSALEIQKQNPQAKLGEILIEHEAASSKQVMAAIRTQKKSPARTRELQVKVDTDKLDTLVDLTGELVIAQAMLRQHPYVQSLTDQRLVHTLGQLNQITSGLQKMSMSLRMVPIKSAFQKMIRLVRDLTRHSGKNVQLLMEGEDTEIDRNVVDELYEPMVHMIRNCVDHGLESCEDRIKAGKEPTGKIGLKAYHRGGNIIVEISDDGKGLDKNNILKNAISKGLIDQDARLPDNEIYNLIFQPGFSTANQVSEISGRGVGMDVVKKGIETLRGRVDINTSPGMGSTFVIRLPLTLAIIEGMLVRTGNERYIIPALSIIESFRLTPEQYFTVEGKGELIYSRGALIPMVRLDRLFNLEPGENDISDKIAVTLEHDGKRMCLLLDELLGKEEIVIKSMGERMKDVKGIAGGAILGDGKVGLIIDMAGIWNLTMN